MRISDWSSDVCSSDLQTSIRSEIEGQLHAPELVDVHRPSVDSAADVRAAYPPQGVGGLPAGPGSGQPSGAADIIETGKAEHAGPTTAAQTLRGQRVQGGAGVQVAVSGRRAHGFFHDPNLHQEHRTTEKD